MQVLVVGAGVVGLAVARAAAIAGHEVVVAEAAAAIGTGISSRNSEVIHAGLYYPTGSSRAYHCTRGRRMLYAFCASHGVPHRKCGKLVVATNESERERLAAVHKQAEINGVEGVEIIDAAAAKRLEPELACVAAMRSPETGIIDSHGYMLALRGDLEDHGGMVAFDSPIERLRPRGRRLGRRHRRQRSAVAELRRGRQLRRARRPAARAGDRRLSGRAGAAARTGERQLLQFCRPAGVLAADLSGAGAGRARRARDARPRRAHALRAGRRMDRGRELRRRSRPCAARSMRASATTGRGCRTTRSPRTTPASGRS